MLQENLLDSSGKSPAPLQLDSFELEHLYSTGEQISRCNTEGEVIQALVLGLSQSSLINLLYIAEIEGLQLIAFNHPERESLPTVTEWIQIPQHLLTATFSEPAIINNPIELPADGLQNPFKEIQSQLFCPALCFLPISDSGKLVALLILGAETKGHLNPAIIRPYQHVINLTSIALGKVNARKSLQKKQAELQLLRIISQSIATEIDHERLHNIVFTQMRQLIGDIDLYIATYDQDTGEIAIPYIYRHQKENPKYFLIEEDLIFHVIQTRQPLLLNGDIERRIESLGIATSSVSVKSWLGVPLSLGEDILGVLVSQDEQRESRFDYDDLRLMSTMATQIAISINNARLLEETQLHVQRERKATEITSKIWSSSDIETILRTTIRELGKALDVSEGLIKLDLMDR